MQELKSTEILDKEIQNDARKKAEKILKNADADCAEILAAVAADVAKAKAEKEAFYEKKLAAFEKDQDAAFPLEKERFFVSFIQETVTKNINAYLSTLSEEKRLELVLQKLDKETLKGKKLNAFVYGFDKKLAEKVLTKKIGAALTGCQETIFGKIAEEDDCGLEKKEGIILETEDKSYRCRLTMSERISFLLDKYRAELSEALFGSAL